MKLTIGETIMILRIRKGMQKQELGKIAFPKMLAPQVKLKKIENGSQAPTDEDLKAIADGLGIQVKDILHQDEQVPDGVRIHPRIFEIAPRLKHYIDILNSCAEIDRPVFVSVAIEELCADKELCPNAIEKSHPDETGGRRRQK